MVTKQVKRPVWADSIAYKERKTDIDFHDLKSVAAMTKFAKEYSRKSVSHNESESDDYKFTGTNNFEEAIEMISKGSKDIMDGLKTAVKGEVKRLNKQYNRIDVEYMFDNEGLFFDIGAVLEGTPEAWLREDYEEGEEEKPTVIMTVMANYSYSKRVDDIIKNAGKVLAIARFLEESGIQTEINLIWWSNNTTDDKDDCAFMLAKSREQAIDYKKISALLHPSFFRRIIFKFREVVYGNELRGGYGRSIDTKNIIRLDSTRTITDFENSLLKDI